MIYRFSANTGFLFKHLPFVQRIAAAAAAGYDAIEFHDEAQRADPDQIADLLAQHKLPLCALNTSMVDGPGRAAIPAEVDQARRDIDAAASLAARLDAGAIHVLAGRTQDPNATATYIANLHHALQVTDRVILIEPLSPQGMPEYFLSRIDQAMRILGAVGHPRLKIMFDVFHIGMTEGIGQIVPVFDALQAHIGHVQIASLPDRADPDTGDGDMAAILSGIQNAGYGGIFGCEYHPSSAAESGLAWAGRLRLR